MKGKRGGAGSPSFSWSFLLPTPEAPRNVGFLHSFFFPSGSENENSEEFRVIQCSEFPDIC